MSADAFGIDQPQPDTLALSGALNFGTVTRVLEGAGAVIDRGSIHVLDLAGVRAADSAGLACVLSLMARGSRHGRRLQVRNLPSSLQRLASVSDAEALLA
jgi:phospholipid transport system transporter-binding protein